MPCYALKQSKVWMLLPALGWIPGPWKFKLQIASLLMVTSMFFGQSTLTLLFLGTKS